MNRRLTLIRRAIVIGACFFASVFWARSYSTADWLWYRTGATDGLHSIGIASCRGTITLSVCRASGRAESDAMEDLGFSHYAVEGEDLAIDPVPPDMRLSAGFGVMTTRPQDGDVAARVWRFFVVPWWGLVTIGVVGSLAIVKLKRMRLRFPLPASPRMRPALSWS